MRLVCVAVCVLWSLVEVHSQSQTEYPYVSFMQQNSFMRQKLTNHSYVNLTLRNMSNNVLVGCHTDLMTCCNSTNIHQGDWYFPNGERVKLKKDDVSIYKKRGNKQVSIQFINDAIIPSGIFRCDIPTSNTEKVIKHNTLYVGLYTSGGINITFQQKRCLIHSESHAWLFPCDCLYYVRRCKNIWKIESVKRYPHLYICWWACYHCHLDQRQCDHHSRN